MAEQLDVFLGKETLPFLDKLFIAIQTEEYLNEILPVSGADEAAVAGGTLFMGETDNDHVVINNSDPFILQGTHENTPPIDVSLKKIQSDNCLIKCDISLTYIIFFNRIISLTNLYLRNFEYLQNENLLQFKFQIKPPKDELLSKSSTISVQNSEIESPISIKPSPPIIIKTALSPIRSDKNEKENITSFAARRRKIQMRSRSRSRSRSYEKSRRSRSRERRLNEREKNLRQFRNRSPITIKERKRQERSPRSYGKSRHRSNSNSRSRSGSPDRHKISRSMSPSKMESGPPAKRMRCRDFDEKGYCMRGETCPWDHGVDPVVLEDINNPALISSIQSGAGSNNVRSGVGSGALLNEYSPDAPDLWSRVGNAGGNFMGPRGNLSHRSGSGMGSYPRGPNSNFRGAPPFQFPGNSNSSTQLQRELIPVPVVEGGSNNSTDNMGQSKRRFDIDDNNAMTIDGSIRRKLPINTRLGPRIQQNCSLELRKVPRGLNSIAHLNNHFSKFGKIFNIQISYDGDPEAAIITFSSHAEANVAYRSTEAVLNNRFIKVFWHSPGGNANNANAASDAAALASSNAHKEESQSRRIFTSQHTLSNVPAAQVNAASVAAAAAASASNSAATSADSTTDNATSKSLSATTTASTSTTSTSSIAASVQSSLSSLINPTNVPQTAGQIRLKTNRITRATKELIRKKKEEQVKNAVQIAHGLYKRKTDLLQEYVKQLKSAFELYEKVDHTDPARAKYFKTIKELESSMEKLKEEIANEKAQISASMSQSSVVPVKKSKEQQQKELLDIELELITQQQEGNDTTALQKKLQELQRAYGTTSTIARPPFPRAPRVRPAPPGSTSVDRRPTTLLIVGFSAEESDAILGHLKVIFNLFILLYPNINSINTYFYSILVR